MTRNTASKIQPAPGIAGVSAYSVPKHPAPIDLKLDANEGEAPDAALLKRILEIGPDVMRRYPDASSVQRLLAERFRVDAAKVIVTAGADDALDRLCRAVLAPGRQLILTNPSFEMLPRYARIAGADVLEIPWWSGAFPTDRFLEAITPRTALIAVVSPNNPTGIVATRDDLLRLSDAAPHAVILLDHAYVEFADEDFTEFALALPNAIVVRTLSKAWGLAGLRVGYAIADAQLIGWMRASGGPYAVSRPSIALAAARLEADHGEMKRFVTQIRRDRDRLHALLAELGVPHSASEANYVFTTGGDALWMRDALAALGIAVRAYPGNAELGNCLRITCPGDEKDCDRLLGALRTAVKPSALIVAADEACLSGADMTRLARRIDTQPLNGARYTPGTWLLCTSHETIAAARKAGALPVAWHPTITDAESFKKAGAARLLNTLDELESLLP